MATLDLDEEPEFQTDLRPCPFCKGKVKLMKYIDHYYIRCAECEVIMHAKEYGKNGVDELVQRWNGHLEERHGS